MLKIENLYTQYGKMRVLNDVSLEIKEDESVVTLIGANGAGKTTLLKAISGLIHPVSGSISFLGKRIDRLKPEEIVKLGISHVPQGRRLFPQHTIMTNLEMGAYTRSDKKLISEDIQFFLNKFPILAERAKSRAGLLSGGEQGMLAISRALMSRPRLLLMDEPSMGLAPMLIDEIYGIIEELCSHQKITIFLVEQNAIKALNIAQRGYVLEMGKIVLQGNAKELLHNDKVRKAYLG